METQNKANEKKMNILDYMRDLNAYAKCRNNTSKNAYYLSELESDDLKSICKYALLVKDCFMLQKVLGFFKEDDSEYSEEKYYAIRQIYYLKIYKNKDFLKFLSGRKDYIVELAKYFAHDHNVDFLKANFAVFDKETLKDVIHVYYMYDNKFDGAFIKEHFTAFIGEAFSYKVVERLYSLLTLALEEPAKYMHEIDFIKEQLLNLNVKVNIPKFENDDMKVAEQETAQEDKKHIKVDLNAIWEIANLKLKEIVKNLDLVNRINKLKDNIMGLISNIPLDKAYLKVLLISKNYKKIEELIAEGKIKATDLSQDEIIDIIEFVKDHDLIRISNLLFKGLDDITKASIIRYYYDNNFVINKELIGEDLDQFIDVCINKECRTYIVLLANLANQEQLGRLQTYLLSLELNDLTYDMFAAPVMTCAEIQTKIMKSPYNTKYYKSLSEDVRKQAMINYIKSAPSFEDFKNLFIILDNGREIISAIMSSDLDNSVKSNYLLSLLELVNEDLRSIIINDLLEIGDYTVLLHLANNYLVVNRKIRSNKLLKVYLESKLEEEKFESFLNSVDYDNSIYAEIISSNLSEPIKNNYLYHLVKIAPSEQKLSIIKYLLSSEDQVIITKLASKYLVLDGHITSEILLRIYLENKPLMDSFEAFLDSVQEYELVYKTINSVNLSNVEKSNYLYMLINYYDVNIIIEALLQLYYKPIIDKLIRNYLFKDGKIVNLNLLREYLNSKPQVLEFKAVLGNLVEYQLVVAGIFGALLSDEEKCQYLDALLEMDTDLERENIEKLILGFNIPNYVRRHTNNMIQTAASDKKNDLIKRFLLAMPTESTLEQFIVEHNCDSEAYQVLKALGDALDVKMKSEYLYVIGSVTENEELALNVADDILALNHFETVKMMMATMDKDFQEMYIEQAMNGDNEELLLTLACTTNCKLTAPLIKHIIAIRNPELIANMLYKLNRIYAYTALEALAMDLYLYESVLETIRAMEYKREEKGEEKTKLLSFCVKYIFETGRQFLFRPSTVSMMSQIMDQESKPVR